MPGAARKTANVVLGTAFGIASGVVVDTHVQRISRRLDLTKETDPVKIEKDLMKIIPKEKWILFSHQIIHHGRALCIARNPRCAECRTGAAVLLERQDCLRRDYLCGRVVVRGQMQALVDGVERQFQAVGNAQLVEDVVQMVLHRLLADEHLLGHFLVLVALRHQRDDFALARR